MYLKQIELHGFKSFANDTILTFEKGITGIVGPNGSGKSNIADAVRWVLGERSMKQLRGADTLDVIFSGTELRKAQGFAYVNLIIDNSDRRIPISYDEIQVSRRLYRSGESEYKLNNVGCFEFSRENGTKAYDMPNQISNRVKAQRYNKVMNYSVFFFF